MFKIACRLATAPSDPELRYLYGSRKAWLPASLSGTSDAWTRALMPKGQNHTAQTILGRIGIDDRDRKAICAILGMPTGAEADRLDSRACRTFIAQLTDNEDVSRIIRASSARAHETVCRYFEQEGLFDDISWAIVDTGWSLNCQAALKRIISWRTGVDFRPRGFYLALMDDHLGESEAGSACSFSPPPQSTYCRRRTMVEHCLTPSLHTSTKGYVVAGGISAPVFGPEIRSEAELIYVSRLHQICEVQAEIVASDALLFARLRAASDEASVYCETFILNPRRSEAESLQALTAAPDFFHESSFAQAFCRPLDAGDFRRLLSGIFSRETRFRYKPIVWLEGSCILSPAYIRIPLRFLLQCKLLLTRMRQKTSRSHPS
jgi:hypothetical protein